MSESSYGVDRRRCERALLKTDLFYSLEAFPEVKAQSGTLREIASLVDLGERGIGFVSESEFIKDSKMEVSFDLALRSGKNFKVQAVGVVRYCFLQADYKTFRVGLEFTKIKGDAKRNIVEYVREFLKG
jgi:hypothetical protein